MNGVGGNQHASRRAYINTAPSLQLTDHGGVISSRAAALWLSPCAAAFA